MCLDRGAPRGTIMDMRYLALLIVPGAALADCPPPPDFPPRHAELMEEVRTAPNEMSARAAANQLWEIWADAPDAKAQAMLDEGMRARASWDFETAEEAFDSLVAYCPDYAEGYNQRAFVNFLRRDFETALVDLDRALALSPEHIAALSGRALTLLGLGRDEEGQIALREALRLNPWLPERRLATLPPEEEL